MNTSSTWFKIIASFVVLVLTILIALAFNWLVWWLYTAVFVRVFHWPAMSRLTVFYAQVMITIVAAYFKNKG